MLLIFIFVGILFAILAAFWRPILFLLVGLLISGWVLSHTGGHFDRHPDSKVEYTAKMKTVVTTPFVLLSVRNNNSHSTLNDVHLVCDKARSENMPWPIYAGERDEHMLLFVQHDGQPHNCQLAYHISGGL